MRDDCFFCFRIENKNLPLISLIDEWSDDLIWNYAKKNRLTIISIDADFSNRILLEDPLGHPFIKA
ncbi:MAG: DUF5615 family PIN-like protein [Ignavibacteria bacterium]|nr:DUF5615 family PIN-like protein [Ignavibacteria bacterium]MBK9404643.1 DUF5615 family PIN-like protein [Ignavibacteria bacterium]MBL0108129.1 DUF5615 family PIN-like protein [Ignavibacteria bacterium]